MLLDCLYVKITQSIYITQVIVLIVHKNRRKLYVWGKCGERK